MPFSSGLEPGGYSGRVQLSPRGPRSLSIPTEYSQQRQLRQTMEKLQQGYEELCLQPAEPVQPARIVAATSLLCLLCAAFRMRAARSAPSCRIQCRCSSHHALVSTWRDFPSRCRRTRRVTKFRRIPTRHHRSWCAAMIKHTPLPVQSLSVHSRGCNRSRADQNACLQPDVLLRQFATRGDAPSLELLLQFCARDKTEEETEDEITKVKTTVITYNPAEGVDFKEGARELKEGQVKTDFKGRGIDVRNTHNGFTAFHWCCQNGTDKLIDAAAEAQAQLDSDSKNKSPNPHPDYIKCMELLVKWAANPTLLDFMGRTGRDLAALKGNFKMVEALDAYLAEHPWKDED